jgi:phosphatidylglycerophosphatase A
MSELQSDNLNLRESFEKADFVRKTALLLSSWFGAGLMPKLPGTFGTLVALPLVMVMIHLGGFYGALFLMIFIPIAIWSSGLTQRYLGRDDPREVVIDEVAGLLLTFFLLPFSWLILFLGFVLFRFFDILKPFPIGMLEKKISGGTGIVIDDFIAGVYANLCLRLFLLFFGNGA